MPGLDHTKVYRGGVTAPHLTIETSKCSFYADAYEQAVDFRFNLASKGGGTTSVLMRLGIDDLPQILEAVAKAMPHVGGMLSDSASIAIKRNLEMLAHAQKVQKDERERARAMVDKLEVVEEYVSEKYSELPVGEDERESKVRDELSEVLSALRSLK